MISKTSFGYFGLMLNRSVKYSMTSMEEHMLKLALSGSGTRALKMDRGLLVMKQP